MNIETRLTWASVLIGLGIFVQLLSRLPVHPLAFMTFLMIGVVLYLTSLLSSYEKV